MTTKDLIRRIRRDLPKFRAAGKPTARVRITSTLVVPHELVVEALKDVEEDPDKPSHQLLLRLLELHRRYG